MSCSVDLPGVNFWARLTEFSDLWDSLVDDGLSGLCGCVLSAFDVACVSLSDGNLGSYII